MAPLTTHNACPGPIHLQSVEPDPATSGDTLININDAASSSSAAVTLPSNTRGGEALPDYFTLNQPLPISYHRQPTIEGGVFSSKGNVVSTCWPEYSRSSDSLERMIREQSNYPPTYTLRLIGNHTESRKTTDDRVEVHTITDFDVRLDLTHLLMCPNPIHATDPTPCADCYHICLIAEGVRGHRGRLVRTTGPHHEGLTEWCEAFVASKSPIKTFTLDRGVIDHNTAVLKTACTQLVCSTSYRGNINVDFEIKNNHVTVYCDSFLNRLRFNKCVCWFFYLTFLWVVAWPILWLSSKHFAPVVALFSYHKPNGSPMVQSEMVFFDEWKGALRRAVISRHQGWVDTVYRAEGAQMDGSGSGSGLVHVRRDGNAVVRVAMGGPVRVGWGAHS